MKPARSPQSTGFFLIFAQSARTVAVTSGAVVIGETTSTSFITAAGLKKCMPMTSSGREVAAAHSTTGSEEVVVARIVPGLQTSSSAENAACLTPRSSAMASTTMSHSARPEKSTVVVMRPRVSSRSASVSLPLTTAFSSDLRTAATAPSPLDSERPRTTTS